MGFSEKFSDVQTGATVGNGLCAVPGDVADITRVDEWNHAM